MPVGGTEVWIYRTGPAQAAKRHAGAARVAGVRPPAEVHGPLPWLPGEVQLKPAGDGATAVAPSGWSVTWVSRPMSADEPVLIGWDYEQGDPRVEVIDLAGAAAVLVESELTGRRWLVRPTGPERGWLLIGSLPRADLLRVAASLPAAP